MENEWFWSKVQQLESGCWEWTGYRNRNGYGLYGKPPKGAHRISYEMHKGPIPDGLVVCHTCDNPPCVNPAHLWVGTKKDNSRDMARKQRSGQRKLTDEQVIALRTDGRTLKEIGAEYGVHYSVIAFAKRGQTWKHVPGAVPGRKRAKITADQVRAIREDRRTAKVIGAEYGLSFQQVRRIIRREKWADV